MLPTLHIIHNVFLFYYVLYYIGISGDVGTILVNDDLLLGDDPRMEVEEITPGMGDIVPGSFTYEVQTISTFALSTLSGTFRLNMEGYITPDIDVAEGVVSFRQKLEYLKTIYTVKVKREVVSVPKNLYAWTITFAHMTMDVVQVNTILLYK